MQLLNFNYDSQSNNVHLILCCVCRGNKVKYLLHRHGEHTSNILTWFQIIKYSSSIPETELINFAVYGERYISVAVKYLVLIESTHFR